MTKTISLIASLFLMIASGCQTIHVDVVGQVYDITEKEYDLLENSDTLPEHVFAPASSDQEYQVCVSYEVHGDTSNQDCGTTKIGSKGSFNYSFTDYEYDPQTGRYKQTFRAPLGISIRNKATGESFVSIRMRTNDGSIRTILTRP